ncbi:MAG: hypothetical protein P4L92_12265 [Rudaea sp.]|nr:hypothetical protein [Rudaea sp.]
MRWILLLVTLFSFAIVFTAKSAALLGFFLVLGLGALFGSMFSFAAERVAAVARPDAVLLTDKDINVLRASIRKPAANATASVSSANIGSANAPSANRG